MARDVARERAEQQWLLRRAERSIDSATLTAIGTWLDAFRLALLQELGVPQALVAAAGDMDPASAHIDYSIEAAVARSWGEWQNQLENQVLPTVSIAFGEAFQQTRRADPQGAFRHQQQYLAEVSDRLKIWPQGAFEDIRPELLEALSEAETVDQMTDRIGRVLTIDAKSRELRAQINEVEERLASPDLDPAERAELRAWRKDLWEQHDESLNEWQWKARRIARTESHGAVSAGQLAAAKEREQLTGIRMWKRWLSTEDSRTRASHRVADGQTVPLDQPFRVGGFLLDHPADAISVAPHEVINCVVGETVVSGLGQRLGAAARRIHEGSFVHLVTADGHDLTVTPNHPILTPRGYVAASRIKPGDDLITTPIAVDPQVNDGPPRVDELFGAIREAGMRERVVSSGMDLHGDAAMGTEIEIVRPDWLLGDEYDTARSGGVGEQPLGGLGDGEGSSAGNGTLSDTPQVGSGVFDGGQRLAATSGAVGSSGTLASLLDRGSFRREPVSLTAGPNRQAEFMESTNDSRSADADSAAHLQHAYAIGMKASQVVLVDSYFGRHWVYNLTTSDHWYIGNGIWNHNCRCSMILMDDDELQDEFDEQGGKGPVEPGAVRIGPDDPERADEAIVQVAEREGRVKPKVGQRGEDAGQSMPAEPVDVEITDERTPIPAPDVETATEERLADYLIRTDEREDDELRALVEEELARRRDSDEIEVQFGEPEHADDVLEVDDDGDWLDDPRWASDDEDLPPVTDDDEPDWDDWQVDDDDLPGDVVPADPPEIVENIGSQDLDAVQAEFDRVQDEFADACESGDEARITEALARLDEAEGRLNEATQAAEVDDDSGLEPDEDDPLEDLADSYDPDDPDSIPPGYEHIAEIFGVQAAREDYERDQANRPQVTDADRRRYELMDQADQKAEAEGISYEQALAELQGLDLEQLRRREFVARAKTEGLSSTNFADLLDELHRRLAFDWLLMAESETRGHMLSRRSQAAGEFDESMLWRVNDATARRHMPDEMAAWFDANGRITKGDLERMIEAGLDVFDAEGALGEWATWRGKRFGEDYLR